MLVKEADRRGIVSIRQHTSAYVRIVCHMSRHSARGVGEEYGLARHTSAYVSIRQHTSELSVRGLGEADRRGNVSFADCCMCHLPKRHMTGVHV